MMIGAIVWTPSHAVKRGKRYRYYVSQAVIQGRPERQGATTRVPAHDIEMLVVRRLSAFLGSAREVRNAASLETDDAATQRALVTAAATRSARWNKFTTPEARAFLLAVIWKIVLREGGADILVSKLGLRLALLVKGDAEHRSALHGKVDEETDIVRLTINAYIKRCGMEVRLIVPGNAGPLEPQRPNASLVKAIARARDWYEELLAGKAAQYSIAAKNGISDRYLSRILRCAFLAPDIVEAILEGRHPPDLSLDKLVENLPLDWAEQRRVLGFSGNQLGN